MAPMLYLLGILRAVDPMPLAEYCTAFARWRAAETALAEMGGTLTVEGGTGPRVAPLVRISAASARA
jgi:hypothetical protein